MTGDPHVPAPPAVQAAEALAAAVAALAQAPLWSLAERDLIDLVVAQETINARFEACRLAALAELDARGIPAAAGAKDTGAWLRDTTRSDAKAGNARRRLARALKDDHPATGAALAAGAINGEQAKVIVKAVRGLNRKLSADKRTEAETYLLEQAKDLDPKRLEAAAKYIAFVADPDGPEPRERDAHKARSFWMRDRGDGSHAIGGNIPDIVAAKLKAALDPLAAPRPAVDGITDDRTGTQRHADALESLLDRYLAHATAGVPTKRGERPHLVIRADLDILLRLPGTHTKPAWTETGETVSAAMLRKLACDAGVTRILTGPDGLPLDVGREKRTATWAQWKALVERDGGCTGPGCDVPAAYCDAHHLRHWADGGLTNFMDMTLACTIHHNWAHHEGWEPHMGLHGRVEWVPPAWIDITRRPRVNTYRHWIPTLYDPT